MYFIYILTNKSNRVLYTGMTKDLERRIYEHKHKRVKGFTSKYNVNKLVFFEEFTQVLDAIAAEKKIKGWVRRKKIELIEKNNPLWRELESSGNS